ncbi:MAG: hypothetical protein DLM60_23630 [Pseudonocardiales bacterium]|nr:MAG: hypothetical protein DLM60_23630 [Pseudonocardiales bacterium]
MLVPQTGDALPTRSVKGRLMTEHPAFSGTRTAGLGAGRVRERADGPGVPRQPVSYRWARGHRRRLMSALSAVVPELWSCRSGSRGAGGLPRTASS